MRFDLGRYRRRYVDVLAEQATHAGSVLRAGLGVVLVLAGAHKLVAPAVWTAYAAPWLTAVWPESVLGFERFMVLNGVVEVLFGLGLVANVYTAVLAGITALSLAGVVLTIATGGALAGEHVDVLIRDLGLAVLAAGVALQSARRQVDAAES